MHRLNKVSVPYYDYKLSYCVIFVTIREHTV